MPSQADELRFRMRLELLGDSDGEKSQRVMKAMMKMKKLDIAVLKEAALSQ